MIVEAWQTVFFASMLQFQNSLTSTVGDPNPSHDRLPLSMRVPLCILDDKPLGEKGVAKP